MIQKIFITFFIFFIFIFGLRFLKRIRSFTSFNNVNKKDNDNIVDLEKDHETNEYKPKE